MIAPADETLGLIAGAGDLPRQVAEAARASGRNVAVVALEGFTDAWVDDYPSVRASMGEFGAMLDHFRDHAVSAVTFVGRVERPDFASFRTDVRGAAIMDRVLAAAAQGDDAILRVVLEVFEEEGFMVIRPEALAPDLVAEPGVLGAHAPDAAHEADIDKAVEVARVLGRFDVGQGAVVCAGVVLAVEAQEGTDRMLARVGELPVALRGTPEQRRGVLVKVPKPIQDRRIDLPTIGAATVEGAARAGLAGIAVEAGGALVVDRGATVRAADAAGLFIVVRPATASEGAKPE